MAVFGGGFPTRFAGRPYAFTSPPRLEGMASGLLTPHGMIVPFIIATCYKHGFKRIGGVACTVPATL
ncbi:MAG: hypothetical protein QW351_08655 [Candidatus Caldarchaeum sp.]